MLTTHHITDIFFDSPRPARRRLLQLYEYGLVDRFRPRAESGSAPDHYVMGKGGAEIVAAYLGEDYKKIYDKDLITRLAFNPSLKHLLSVNSFYSRLARACRDKGYGLEWWGEERTRRSWTGVVIPDGFGRIQAPARSRTAFLEVDLGTESLSRLEAKLSGYQMAAETDRAPDLVLFCFPSTQREVNARQVLKPVGITIATTRFNIHASDPLGRIWLPLANGARHSLLDLPLEQLTIDPNGGDTS